MLTANDFNYFDSLASSVNNQFGEKKTDLKDTTRLRFQSRLVGSEKYNFPGIFDMAREINSKTNHVIGFAGQMDCLQLLQSQSVRELQPSNRAKWPREN